MRICMLSIALIACGGSNHNGADAPRDGTHGDAAGDAASDAVAITVTASGAPRAGVQVVFSAADGAPIATVMTDASGNASQVMAAGGMVTAIDPFVDATGGPSALFTYEDVKPGDHLQLAGHGAQDLALTVTFDASMFAGAGKYLVTAPPCGSLQLSPSGSGSGVTGTQTFPSCAGADVYVVAVGATNVVGSLYHPAVSISNNATVDLTADAYASPIQVSYAYSNVPATATSIGVGATVASANGLLHVTPANVAVTGGSASFSLVQPAPDGATEIVNTVYADGGTSQEVLDWTATLGSAYTLDATGLSLPTVSDQPQFSRSTNTLTWTPGAAAMAPDLISLSFAFVNAPAIASWQIVAPYSGGSFALPQLADYLPPSTATTNLTTLVMRSVPGGYDAVRALALSQIDPSFFMTATAASGRALVATYVGGCNDVP